MEELERKLEGYPELCQMLEQQTARYYILEGEKANLKYELETERTYVEKLANLLVRSLVLVTKGL